MQWRKNNKAYNINNRLKWTWKNTVIHHLLNMVMKAVAVILSLMLCILKPWATKVATLRDCVYWINWVIKRLWGTFVRSWPVFLRGVKSRHAHPQKRFTLTRCWRYCFALQASVGGYKLQFHVGHGTVTSCIMHLRGSQVEVCFQSAGWWNLKRNQ